MSLADEDVILRNVPQIGDVKHLLEILSDLGVAMEHLERGVIRLNASGVNGKQPNVDIAKHSRIDHVSRSIGCATWS